MANGESFSKLKEFVEVAKELNDDSGIAKIEYELGKEKFSIKFHGNETKVEYVSPQGNYQAPVSNTPASSPASSGVGASDGLLEITSPFVGTFYRAASPDSAPYVKEGDKIGEGKVLCIVEAMKIMNEIESEISGEIVEICVENETYVEFGQVLFRVKK